ncbi:MAG: ABC transporter permease [Clostridiaceae bacterium]|nr:ABC transporter permease [Clostridiaceae bacterium]
MFAHIYLTRLKISFRDRQMLFWTLLFPLILATFFGMAFSNLHSGEAFKAIPIAVVDNDAYQKDSALQQALQAVSQKDDSTAENSQDSGEPLFSLSRLSEAAAEKALSDGKIIGYLIPGATLQIIVGDTGLQQTILKIFADEYLHLQSAIQSIVGQDPAAWQTLSGRVNERIDLIRDKPAGAADPDNVLVYYYALIAMSCLYGGFWGLKEIILIQGNLSDQAARINLVPVHKMKLFISSLLAALTIQYLSILLLIAYLNFILKISFGSQIGYILLAGLTGSVMGVAIGAFIGASSKLGEGIKTAFLIAISMICSFFSGLMVGDIKYLANKAFPLLSRLNPANLVSDAFYALYYYDTYTRYWTNIGLQLLLTAILFLFIFLAIRRQRYASL